MKAASTRSTRSRRSRRPTSCATTIAAVREVHCAHSVLDYVLDVADATRDHPGVVLGASPRASLGLLHAAQAHATVMGRDFVSPDDVKAVAPAALAHRIVLAHGVDVRARLAGRRARSSASVAIAACRESRRPACRARVHRPGDLTLTSIVLFTLGAYGVAAGAATGEQSVVAVGVFAFTLFVIGIVVADRRARRASSSRRGRAPTPRSATPYDVHVRLHGHVLAGRGAGARPAR